MSMEVEIIDIISKEEPSEVPLDINNNNGSEVIDIISLEVPLDIINKNNDSEHSSNSSISSSRSKRLLDGENIGKSTINSNNDIIERLDDWGLTYSDCEAGESREITRKIHRAEKALIDFAIHLVVLEMVGGGIGILAFIWATTVLLGGFANELEHIDFWFVSIILFIEGTRIFNANHRVDSHFFFRAVKAMFGSSLPNGEQSNKLEQSKSTTVVGGILTSLQLLSAITCITLSLMRIIAQHFGVVNKGISNKQGALIIFYMLALVQAVLFLTEEVYWYWRVSYQDIIEKVRLKCAFGTSGVVSLRRFFYDTYWTCKKNGVFHALDMDLITFSKGLLLSDSRGDQLIAIRILECFVHNNDDIIVEETSQRIKNSKHTVERLLKMLTWQNQSDRPIRILSATIMVKLAKYENFFVGIPGAVQSVSSLLENSRSNHSIELNMLGLKILNNLANNPDSCRQMVNTRGLVSSIIGRISPKPHLVYYADTRIKLIRRSLQLLNKLLATTGKTGKMLRREISQIVFTVSNIRDTMMEYGDEFQIIDFIVQIVKNLSLEKTARKNIGNTGKIIQLLLHNFFVETRGNHRMIIKTGEALLMLSMESKINCGKILKEPNVVKELTRHFDNGEEGADYVVICTKLLRNLCEYSGAEFPELVEGVKKAFPAVIELIVHAKVTLVESLLGLSIQMFKMIPKDYARLLTEASPPKDPLMTGLFTLLRQQPDVNRPSIRRYAIEQLCCLMRSDNEYTKYFMENDLRLELEKVLKTTSEFEGFKVVRGTEGFFSHKRSMHSLVEEALDLLAGV